MTVVPERTPSNDDSAAESSSNNPGRAQQYSARAQQSDVAEREWQSGAPAPVQQHEESSGDQQSDAPTSAQHDGKSSRAQQYGARFWMMVISMILLLVAGVGILLYPSISDMYNRHISSQAVATYEQAADELGKAERARMLEEARVYNTLLVGEGTRRFLPSEESHQHYESLLDVTGNGIMAYVTVPKISIRTPVYHGTSDAVLQIAAGHIEGSSLPVGGASTHAAMSGHTGLPSALLFTGLDRLEHGDTFTVTVFDEVLTYEVSAIHVVEPDDVSNLEIVEGQDLVSLITCTPYGVNTHRLIVTGHRVPTVSVEQHVDRMLVRDIALIAGGVALAMGVVASVFWRRRHLMQRLGAKVGSHMGAKMGSQVGSNTGSRLDSQVGSKARQRKGQRKGHARHKKR